MHNVYNYFRTYDPSTGRYLTSDPVGLLGGSNTYGYALQSPTNYSDRYGLDVWGLNFGIGLTFRIKGAANYAFLLDDNGNFAIQRTVEIGGGSGKAGGAILNLVYGLPDTVDDLNGYGVAISGSRGPVNAAVSLPFLANIERDKCGKFIEGTFGFHEPVIEIGRAFGFGREAGVTMTRTDTLYRSTVLGDIGSYIGGKVFDWTH